MIVLLLFFALLFSVHLVAAETDHDCTGEDCPICAVIHQCENTLRSLDPGFVFQPFAAPLILFNLLAVSLPGAYFVQETPVSEKVRMDN